MEHLHNAAFVTLSLLAVGIACRQRDAAMMMLWTGLASVTLIFGLKNFLPQSARVEQVIVVDDQPLYIPITATPLVVNGKSAINWKQVAAMRPDIARWQSEIDAAAIHCGVEPLLIAAVMTQESRGDPNICSSVGACGLMQLMPGTAQQMSVADRFDPEQNVLGGACYLRQMLDRYQQQIDVGLAAYNAGPGNVDKYGGIPPFKETQKYVRNVRAFYAEYLAQQQMVNAQPAASASLTTFASPPVLGNYRISGGYSKAHPGLDIVGATTLLAVMDGIVHYVGPLYRSSDGDSRCVDVGCLGPFAIVLNHAGGTFTIYGHNSCSYVQAGEQVQAGQVIGCVGNMGRSTGDHVHFELRINETWNDDPGWPWSGDYRSAIDPTSMLP